MYKSKNRINIILDYLIAIVVILDFNTIYSRLLSFSELSVITTSILVFPFIYALITNEKSFVNQLGFIFIYLLGGLIPFMITERRIIFFLLFILTIPFLWIFTASKKEYRYFRGDKLLLRLSNVIMFLAFQSLAFWILGSILGIIKPTGTMYCNWSGYANSFVPSYFGVYFERQVVSIFGIRTIRNSSIFCEAPVYNFLLCVGLAIELYLRPKELKSKYGIFIYVATILSTLTTTGQLFLLLSVFLWLLNKKKTGIYGYIYILMPFLFAALYFLSDLIIQEKSETHSYAARSEAISSAIDIFFKHPFFGQGFCSNGDLQINSLFYLLCEGGVYMFLLYFYALMFIPLRDSFKTGKYNWAYFAISFTFVFTVTLGAYRLLSILLIAIGLANMTLNRKRLRI